MEICATQPTLFPEQDNQSAHLDVDRRSKFWPGSQDGGGENRIDVKIRFLNDAKLSKVVAPPIFFFSSCALCECGINETTAQHHAFRFGVRYISTPERAAVKTLSTNEVDGCYSLENLLNGTGSGSKSGTKNSSWYPTKFLIMVDVTRGHHHFGLVRKLSQRNKLEVTFGIER